MRITNVVAFLGNDGKTLLSREAEQGAILKAQLPVRGTTLYWQA